MNRVNYTGLKQRDTYDEIVALVESGGGVIKYPNRVASQILNSPYMKQIDNETLMDLQNQQERLNKQGLKDMLTKTIAQATGKSHWEIRSLVDQEKQASVVGQAQAGLEGIGRMEENMEDMKQSLADMLLEKQKKNELRKQQMALTVSQHLDGVPVHELADNQAVLVRHMRGGKGKSFGKSSGKLPFRAEDDTTEHEREREQEGAEMATTTRETKATQQDMLAERARQAVAEHEATRSQAQPVAQTIAQSFGSLISGMFASPPSPSISEQGQIEQREARSRERQRKEREREARSLERRQREELEELRAAAENPHHRSPASSRRSAQYYNIGDGSSASPSLNFDSPPRGRSQNVGRSRQVSRERSKSRDDDVRVTRTASSGRRKKLSSPQQMRMG